MWGDLEERKSGSEIEALKKLNPNNEIRSTNDAAVEGGEEMPRADLAQSSAKAFECCIKEYGVLEKKRRKNSDATRNEGDIEYGGTWLRRFRMFGTVINTL